MVTAQDTRELSASSSVVVCNKVTLRQKPAAGSSAVYLRNLHGAVGEGVAPWWEITLAWV